MVSLFSVPQINLLRMLPANKKCFCKYAYYTAVADPQVCKSQKHATFSCPKMATWNDGWSSLSLLWTKEVTFVGLGMFYSSPKRGWRRYHPLWALPWIYHCTVVGSMFNCRGTHQEWSDRVILTDSSLGRCTADRTFWSFQIKSKMHILSSSYLSTQQGQAAEKK